MDRSRLRQLLRRAIGPAILASLLVASPASAGLLLPEAGSGSPNATHTRTLYIVIAILALFVFIGVESVLVYCMVKFRARRGAVAAQIHGNTRLEIGWTVGAAVILVFITAVTFALLPSIVNPAKSTIDAQGNPIAANAQFAVTNQKPPAGTSMTVRVDGQQYVWRFKYPGQQDVFSYSDMYVPVGMTVILDITSDDVAHSWWIPALGGKADAVPGYVNHTWFRVTKPGTWAGQCAELCGRNHANMVAKVHALPFAEWKAWYDREAKAIQAAKDAAAQQRQQIDAQEGTATTASAPADTTTDNS
jgi:cytochrome c oxidase subunit 2